jgi:N-acetylglucosaminyldiphosphoundecaprenol N-acetyl-beta-D-mannosaminyltransferase
MSPPYSTVLNVDPAILKQIKSARPDILLVALGNPKQEKWIGMYGRELGIPVMIGVGGTLDLIAGKTKRAPRWMQRLGIEWTYRLAQEPRRLWRRYVVDLVGFSSFFVRQWWVMRRGRQVTTLWPATETVMVDRTAVLSPRGRLDLTNYSAFSDQAGEALQETCRLIVNLADVTFLDSAAIGALVGLTKRARDAGGELWMAGVPEPLARTFSMLRLDSFFAFTPDVNSGLSAHGRHAPPERVPRHAAGDWTVVCAPTRLDANSSPAVLSECKALLIQNPYLVLDLTHTSFLASAGLAAMAQLNRLAQKRGGEVRLAGCNTDVQRVIELVRFDRVFSIHGDVDSAIV